MPYAAEHGIALHELRRGGRTLYEELTREDSRSVRIPVRMAPSGAPGNRDCTAAYKIRVIGKWLKAHGASADAPATVALGISLDEFQRARTPDDPRTPYQRRVYPLIERRLDREACRQVIAGAGLPVPPKSSCWFCPFVTRAEWQRRRHEEPDVFWRAVDLERTFNARRAMLGKDDVYLTDKLVPLDRATSPHRQLPLLADEGEDTCESGFCFV
ncbi:MAG TPA: hypothetical protein VF041_23280 [Gemmatimonadaceae bacterium]